MYICRGRHHQRCALHRNELMRSFHSAPTLPVAPAPSQNATADLRARR